MTCSWVHEGKKWNTTFAYGHRFKSYGGQNVKFPNAFQWEIFWKNIKMHQNWHSCRSRWVEQKSQSQYGSNRYQSRENEFPKLTHYSCLLDPIGITIIFGARFVRVWCWFELCRYWLFCSTSRDIKLCQIWSKSTTLPKMPIGMQRKIWPFELHNFWTYGHTQKLCFPLYLHGPKNMP